MLSRDGGAATPLAERHLWHFSLGRVGQLEVLLGGETEHARDDVRRNRLDRRVVVADVTVVKATGEGDLVLGRREVLRQILEILDRLELRGRLPDSAEIEQSGAKRGLGLW